MNETEWMVSTSPAAMLDYLAGSVRYSEPNYPHIRHRSASDRKLRLFACACVRQMWHLLTDPRSRRAVEVAELFADGEATDKERHVAWDQAVSVGVDNYAIAFAAARCAEDAEHMSSSPRIVCSCTADAGLPPATQAALLRDIVGNPFRPGVSKPSDPGGPDGRFIAFERSWLEWNEGTVRRMAEAIYAERAFERMPILADALEDAGATDPAILAHLRGLTICPLCLGTGGTLTNYTLDGGRIKLVCQECKGTGWLKKSVPCVRGCTILDAILGKEKS